MLFFLAPINVGIFIIFALKKDNHVFFQLFSYNKAHHALVSLLLKTPFYGFSLFSFFKKHPTFFEIFLVDLSFVRLYGF